MISGTLVLSHEAYFEGNIGTGQECVIISNNYKPVQNVVVVQGVGTYSSSIHDVQANAAAYIENGILYACIPDGPDATWMRVSFSYICQ